MTMKVIIHDLDDSYNGMLEAKCDRMIAALEAVSARLDSIEAKVDKIPPRWRQHGYRLDGTPREAYSQAITKLD